MLRWTLLVLMSLVFAVGCTKGKGEPQAKAARPDNSAGIKTEVSVEPTMLSRSGGGRLRIQVYVSNLKDEAKEWKFETSKPYSIYAIDTDGRQFRVGPVRDSLVPSTLKLAARETRVFEMGWDGHVPMGNNPTYLPPGRYEIEARCLKALSNTVFIWIEE